MKIILFKRSKIYFTLLSISMLKYQVQSDRNHYTSSPNIDSLFSLAKMSSPSISSHYTTEKQQMESIRSMGKYLLDEEQESILTFQQKNYNTTTFEESHQKKINPTSSLYERGQLSQRNKMEKMINMKKKQLEKIHKLASQQNLKKLNSKLSKTMTSQNSLTQKHMNHQRQIYVMDQILKRRVKEEQEIFKVKEKQRKHMINHTQYYHQKSKKQQMGYKPVKKATKQQLKHIFNQVNKRGQELLKRKQIKIQKIMQEKYLKEMQGTTFYPQLHSSKSLRQTCTRGFLNRLNNDEYHRESKKIQILGQELRKDSFEPKLNYLRNELSKSKIHSFRVEDAYYSSRNRPQKQLQMSLSRLISEQPRSLELSRANKSTQIAMKPQDLQFFFQ